MGSLFSPNWKCKYAKLLQLKFYLNFNCYELLHEWVEGNKIHILSNCILFYCSNPLVQEHNCKAIQDTILFLFIPVNTSAPLERVDKALSFRAEKIPQLHYQNNYKLLYKGWIFLIIERLSSQFNYYIIL